MRKNPMVTGAKAHGVSSTGNPNPKANMPANNIGMHSVPLGAGKPSTFGQGVKPASAQKGVKQGSANKANMPAKNGPDNKVKVGHTKHAVGEVPGYLKSY